VLLASVKLKRGYAREKREAEIKLANYLKKAIKEALDRERQSAQAERGLGGGRTPKGLHITES